MFKISKKTLVMLLFIMSITTLQSLEAYTYRLCNASNEDIEVRMQGTGYCPTIPTFALSPNSSKEYEFPSDWQYKACEVLAGALTINGKMPVADSEFAWRVGGNGETFVIEKRKDIHDKPYWYTKNFKGMRDCKL